MRYDIAFRRVDFASDHNFRTVKESRSERLSKRRQTAYNKRDKEVQRCLRRYKGEWADGLAR